MRGRQNASLEEGPFTRCLTCDRLTRSRAAGRDSVGLFRWNSSPFSKWAHHMQAPWTLETVKHINDLSRAFSGPPPRVARPIGQFGCSTSGARAMCHTSRVDEQRVEPSPSPTSADSAARGGQRPVDLVLRAISERWQVHREIIGNRSMF